MYPDQASIDPTVNTIYDAIRNQRFHDPLVLDLDGNGITTSGINPNAPLLFDQDGDGALTATGWIGSGEAFVVRDLNGNGTIDSGRELFGDSTVLASGAHAGEKAANGFAALAGLDSNADDKFDAADAAFASVKLWKDVNQNGISEAGELFTFDQLGVASINVTGSTSNVDLGGGNTQTLAGSFTRTSGQSGVAGATSLVGNLLLANNNFYRQFTDDPVLTSAATALPQMQGSGSVRDLRPAMSMGTPQSVDLQAKLIEFAASTTRQGQQALVDDLLLKWADTSAGMVHDVFAYNLVLKDGRYVTSDLVSNNVGDIILKLHPLGMEEQYLDNYGNLAKRPTAEGKRLLSKLNVLEAFNGAKFLQFIPPGSTNRVGGLGLQIDAGSGGATTTAAQAIATLWAPQIVLLNQAYDALKDSVYGALALQTRLKPYLDSIGLVIDESGVRFDTTPMVAMLEARKLENEGEAFNDLVDLSRYAASTLMATGFRVPTDSPLRVSLTSLDVYVDGATNGSARDDIYFGNSVANTFASGNGNDLLHGDDGDDRLFGGGGNDILHGGDGNDVLYGGNEYEYEEAGIDWLYGGAGNDRLRGERMVGGAGDDYYEIINPTDTVTELPGEGVDTVAVSDASYTLSDNVENVVSYIYQGSPITRIGNAADNTFYLKGSRGNSVLDGLGGSNTVSYRDIKSGYVRVDLSQTGPQITRPDPRDWASTYYGTDDLRNIQNVEGSTANDILFGNQMANQLSGWDGNDNLMGKDGDDTLYGGRGNDNLSGDAGNDTYYWGQGDGNDSITESAGQDKVVLSNLNRVDVDIVSNSNGGLHIQNRLSAESLFVGSVADESSWVEQIVFADGSTLDLANHIRQMYNSQNPSSNVTLTLGADQNNLTLTGSDNVDGTGNALNNTLTGNSGNNRLYGLDGMDTLVGGVGNDTLSGGLAADSMTGGAGNDTYEVDDAGDSVAENANEGTDLVQSSITYTLGANVENLTLTGTSAINGTGNTADNVLTGNSAANVLKGGAGNDTYIVGTGDTTTEAASAGTDTVVSSIAWTLAANLENLTLTGTNAINGTGNTLNNVLIGNTAANTLSGGTGADTMSGGADNDTYVVDNTGDVVTELPNEGTDLVQSSVTYTLAANVENLTLTGSSAINATGNALDNVLTGNSAANVLTGDAGNDTYIVGTGDTTTEAAGAGTDTVQSTITWTLAANVENLTLTGTSAINGTGNTLNNALTGNSAANVLDGGTGADTMSGSAGNDTYVVDSSGDVVIELPSEGTDLIKSSITYTLTANVENLTFTGTAAINATGNALNNTLTGNSGNNVLDGGTGADTLVGGAGNDTYYVDNTGDVTTEAASAGTDTVVSSMTWTLANNLENLTLTGTAAINATGNSAANTLTGNAGDNVLDGGAGTDTLIGGAGNDSYYLDVAADVVTELANEGSDTVNIGVTYTLGANQENLTLTGTSAINGTGNTLDNVLTGNSAANTLTGNAGNDTLDGKAGADTLIGGAGNDTYWLGRSYGADTVTENDATAGNLDVARFEASVATDQLWFSKSGNNLEVSIIGTSDKLSLSNWYLGNQYHVEQFKTSNGKTLLDSQVHNLVNAMAAFSPPAAGQTSLPAAYASALNPVLAANWQ